jgi:hypothetical protein
MRNVFGQAVTVKADNTRSTEGLQCQDMTVASDATLSVPGGQSVMVAAADGGDASVFIGFLQPPNGEAVQEVQLAPGAVDWVRLPDTGRLVIWHVQITTNSSGLIRVCGPAS